MSLPSFAPLNDDNYSTWSLQMRSFLVINNLGHTIVPIVSSPSSSSSSPSSSVVAAQDSQRALAYITLSLDASQLPHIGDSTTALEAWDALSAVHHTSGLATKLSSMRAFLYSKMQEGTNMKSWISSVMKQQRELISMGVDVTEFLTIIVLTQSLPPSYNNLVIQLDFVEPSALTLSYVTSRLLNESVRLATSSSFESASSPVGLVARPLSEVVCFNCWQKGHYKTTCTNASRPCPDQFKHLLRSPSSSSSPSPSPLSPPSDPSMPKTSAATLMAHVPMVHTTHAVIDGHTFKEDAMFQVDET